MIAVNEIVGIACPKCGCRQMPAVYSKPKLGAKVSRQRECKRCGHKVVCTEKITHFGL